MNTKFMFLPQLKAKSGKEAVVESFLQGEAKLVNKELGSYFVLDAFNDEDAREVHMNGEAGEEFVANKARFFSDLIRGLEVVAQK